MTIDFSEILSRTWKIVWKQKVFWWVGFAVMLVSFLIFPMMFFLMLGVFVSDNPFQWLENPLVWIIGSIVFVVYILLSYGLSSLARPMLVVGVLKVEQDEKYLSFGELLRESIPYFWRFLGLMGLFALSFMLVELVVFGIQILGSILTLGLASLCLTPLSFLLYPLMYVGLVWLELANVTVVVKGMSVMDSLRHSWELLRQNKMNVFIVALVLYLGLGIVSSLFMFPLFIPMFIAPIYSIDHSLSREILWGVGIFSAVFFPIMIFLDGIIFALMETGWVLTYLRLTHKSEEQAILAEANA